MSPSVVLCSCESARDVCATSLGSLYSVIITHDECVPGMRGMRGKGDSDDNLEKVCKQQSVPVCHGGVKAHLMVLVSMQAGGLDLTTSKLSSSASAAPGCPSLQLYRSSTSLWVVLPMMPALTTFHVQLSLWCQMMRTRAQPA